MQGSLHNRDRIPAEAHPSRTTCVGTVKGPPLQDTFCALAPAERDSVGETLDPVEGGVQFESLSQQRVGYKNTRARAGSKHRGVLITCETSCRHCVHTACSHAVSVRVCVCVFVFISQSTPWTREPVYLPFSRPTSFSAGNQ